MNVLQSFPPLLVVPLIALAVVTLRHALRLLGKLLTTGLLIGLAIGVTGTALLGSIL